MADPANHRAPKRIYVIESMIGTFKIGSSRWPCQRAAMVSAHSPCPVRLVATFPGGHADEFALHRQFSEFRSHAEWFRKSGAAADFFESVFGKGVDEVVSWESFDRSYGNMHDANLRARLSAAAKERWSNPEYRERHLESLRNRGASNKAPCLQSSAS